MDRLELIASNARFSYDATAASRRGCVRTRPDFNFKILFTPPVRKESNMARSERLNFRVSHPK